jgi:16S rRNA (uracil1498-N3)-methyltransferase
MGGAHHFFVAPDDVHDGRIEMSGAEGRHAARVLRLRPGENITVADGSGRVIEATVTDVGRGVTAEVRKIREAARPKPSLTLYQAVMKGERMDDVITKAVELGVERVVPFVADRTVVRLDSSKRHKSRERWTAVARAAAKQCRSPLLTTIGEILVGPVQAASEGVPVVVLHESASARLREVLPPSAPDALIVVIGPEGGLAPSEVNALRERGAAVATLGERILRTDTAGPIAAAIIGYAYGNLG